MSRHHDVVVTLAQVFCSLALVVMMSRHRFSCRDISSWYCFFERLSPVVATSTHGFEASSCFSLHVTTSALSLCPFQSVVLGVATSFFCRDIILCCCRLHWLFMMSRLQIFCRDITLLISYPSSAAYDVIPVATCIGFPSIFLMSRFQNWTA